VSDGAPIVIGALGGSGTRVAAQALIDSGAYLGSKFNQAHDNLVFTALFKRPRWFARAGEPAVHRQLDTFVRHMQGRRYGPGDYGRLASSLVDHDPEVDLRESARRVLAAVRSRPARLLTGDRPWGWKEPNSHVYLPQLIDHFPDMRFVYVARHGLDMAYSRNKTQLHMWGPRFGVAPPADNAAAPAAQVDYWIAATRRAVELGGERLGDRFLFLRYDDMCRAPEAELQRLLEFARLPCDDAIAGRLAAGVRPTGSIGRWRAHGEEFTPEQLAAVESFGFEVR
jgi:Sulfotransferase family